MDSRLKISGMTEGGCHSWTPLLSRCPSFLSVSITLRSSPRQSLSRGPQYLKTKEKIKAWMPDKGFQAWQKSTIRGRCPLINPQKRKTWRQKRKIKNNTEEKTSASSFLNGSITLRSSPRQSSSRGPEVSKKQRKSKNLDSRLKISGMTKKGGRHPGNLRAVFSLPLNVFIAPYSSPRQSLSRGPWFLKVFGFPIKNFTHDGGDGFPSEFQTWRKRWMPH